MWTRLLRCAGVLEHFCLTLARSHRDDYVSENCRVSHQYHADTRGVDLPTWHTPTEVNEMRRQARRAELRLVRKRTGTDE